jgi:hypothetical protein
MMAAGVAVVAIVVIGGLTYAGAMTLWNSTDGANAGSAVPELLFPATPTALLAGVSDDGALASLAAVVVRPDGTGGTVVAVPVSADATAGEGDERLPIAETFALEGRDALQREAEIALGVSFDAVEIADAERLERLFEPIGDVDVELPADVTDGSGDIVAEAGSVTMSPADLAAVLTARDPSLRAAEQFGAATAVWDGIQSAVGDGVDTAAPAAAPGTFDAVWTAATAGELPAWDLSSMSIDAARNPRGVDVALLDRAELALVFGQIAPGQVSAPNPSLSFRIIAGFDDEQLAGRPWTNADIAYRAVSQILFLRGNVISVDTTPATAPEENVVEVSQSGINTAGAEQVFGSIEVVDAEERIVGIDAVVRLGTAYLDFLDTVEAQQAGTVGSVPTEDAGTNAVEPVSTDDAAAVTTERANDG